MQLLNAVKDLAAGNRFSDNGKGHNLSKINNPKLLIHDTNKCIYAVGAG